MTKLSLLAASAGMGLALAAVPASFNWSAGPTSRPFISVDRAEAVTGRPLIPGSAAGANRRVNRRAYRGDHSYGAGAGGLIYVSPAAFYYNTPSGVPFTGTYYSPNSGASYIAAAVAPLLLPAASSTAVWQVRPPAPGPRVSR